jgi:GNAT superfamily N-acetyltransferase
MGHFSPIQGIPSARIIRLSQDHLLKEFDCGRKDLNDFLHKDSIFNLNNLLLVTYILEIPDKTIAYFSVANDLLKINVDSCPEFKTHLRKYVKGTRLYTLFQMTAFPAVKLGRLAVDTEYQCRGIGTELVNAMKYSFLTNNKTGCAFITVDAINEEKPLRFYSNNGFAFLSENDKKDESRLMYYTLIN